MGGAGGRGGGQQLPQVPSQLGHSAQYPQLFGVQWERERPWSMSADGDISIWSAAAPGKHPCAIRPKAVRAMKRLAPRSARSSTGGTTRTAVAASEGTGHSCVKALHHWCESVVLTVTPVVMAVDARGLGVVGTSQTFMLFHGGGIGMPISLMSWLAADCLTMRAEDEAR